jgi:ribosome-associated protein
MEPPPGARLLRVTRSVLLPVSEIVIRVSRSSGPGGQHAQKSSTRVDATLDIDASTALSDVQKRRAMARVGPILRAVAQDERSQLRNRELAVERLVEKLRAALAVPRRRVPTQPGISARERRLAEKKRRSRVKTRDAVPNPNDAGHWLPCAQSHRLSVGSTGMDTLHLASLLPGLPTERTRLLDNLGRIRREVGPITPELSDTLADHMNIRRGEVHEVVSFYSFLQVPIDAVRVCTGPVCDCFGARELLERTPGAIEVACLWHCDLAPVR